MTITPQKLRSELAQFTGTEKWYGHWAMRNVSYTDGVKHFADQAGAHWLLDIFATELLEHLKREEFLVLRVKVADEKAELTADDGNDSPPVWRRSIDWTDCPEGEWLFYFAPGGPENTNVLLLPSEY